jgi:DNA gyrase subunit A
MTTPTAGENIRPLLIQDEMKDSYLKYAMSVIVSRALPDVRDGLKPSQRRILLAMHDLNLRPGGKFRKCAKIAGDASGNYHPHGEQVVYPTLVRMGQEWNLRHRLVFPQGNFGSVDGDSPAAMRYTEARLAGPAADLMDDLEKETVDFVDNYDETRKEPTVFPAKFPNLLVNGANGIAVGMASSIPPHNLGEVCDAIVAYVRNPDLTLAELLDIMPGPDFPTAGLICGRAGIHDAFATGRGHLTVRGRVEVEERKNGREALIISEIPYALNKTRLIEKMADCVRSGRIPGISSINDESDREGMRIVVDLKRGEDSRVVLNNLYEHTPLQDTFGVIMISLVDGRPQTLGVIEMIAEFVKHRIEVIRRRTQFLLDKAERRAHILEGLLIALDQIDEVIKTIRSSPDIPVARERLMEHFGLSQLQADAILEMRLSRLTALERDKIEEEYRQLQEKIHEYREILANESLVFDIVIDETEDIKARHADPRRTEITEAIGEFIREDLIADEQVVACITHGGYVKRLPIDTYRTQGRGGRGISGADMKEDDFIEHLFIASTHDYMLFFTNRGKLYWLKVYTFPELGRTSRGRAIVNLLEFEKDEKITSVIPVSSFEDGRYVFMATARGVIKKTSLKAFSRPKKGGIIALRIDEGDDLIGVRLTSGEDQVMLGTAKGKAIRFNEADSRPLGRVTRGVKGIRLRPDDKVVGLAVVTEGASLLTATENGYGKRTSFDEYRVQGRGGQGIRNIKMVPRNGDVIAVLDVGVSNDLIMMSESGMVVRIPGESINVIGRSTQGVRLINLKEGDRLTSVACVPPEEEDGNGGDEETDDEAAGTPAESEEN